MINFLQFVILSLAVFRVVRLIIEDDILEPLRERTTFRLDPRSKIRELLECPWCISFWVGVAAVLLFLFLPTLTIWIALPFALSAITGLIAERTP